MDWLSLGLAFLIGIAVALLNSLAGGGSSLSLPAFIFMGLPAGVANGTNRFGLIWGNLSSFYGLFRKGQFEFSTFKPFALPIMIGAAMGAWCAVLTPDSLYEALLGFVLIGVAILNVVHLAQYQPSEQSDSKPFNLQTFIVFTCVGFYAGLIQVGVGFVMIFAFSKWTSLSLIKINAIKSGIATLFMVQSFLIFLWYGKVHWPLALIYALGCILGGVLGSHLQIKQGEKWLKWAMFGVSLAMALKLLLPLIHF